VDGVSGHSEPSVVNHSDHSAGSELPLRGCGRAHRSPSSAFAKTTLLGQTLLPQTRLFRWLDSARLDSSSCHRVRTRVHGPSVLGGLLACGDRFANSRSGRNFRRPLSTTTGWVISRAWRSVSLSPLTLPSAGQPNGRCGRAYPYSIGTPSSPSESRAAVVSNGPAYAHCRGSMHQTQILLKRGMAHHARARAQSHTGPVP